MIPRFWRMPRDRKLDLLPGRAEELERSVAEVFEASPAVIEIARKYYKQ